MLNRLIISLFILSGGLYVSCQNGNSSDDAVLLNTPEKRALQQAITDAENLYESTYEGTNEGQYPGTARTLLKQKLDNSRSFFNTAMKQAEAKEIQLQTDGLYDACMEYESSVISNLNDLIDPKATRETRYLYENLKNYAPDYLLFGMHDATGYGVGWSGDNDRSDVKDVCGSYPAVFSWDVNAVARNYDWENYRYRMLLAYNNGGINTFCWHQHDPENQSFYYDQVNEPVVRTILPDGEHHEFYKKKLERIARFVKSLRGPSGESVPIIFRPYHEQNGTWFWWGKGHRTEQEFIELWQFTVHYLKDSLGVHSFIYAFSPDGNQYETKEEYLIDYPGDDYSDIFAVDFYFGRGDTQEILRYQRRLIDVVQYSQSRNKLAALTEVGDRYGWDDTDMLEIDRWFTRCLLAPIKTSQTAMHISYAAVWRNAHQRHHFAPYPGHDSVSDFMAFYNDPTTLFADELVDLYILDSGL